MELKYKEREVTNMVRVIFEPEEKTTREIYVEQRKNGLFNIGYHLIVLPDGEVKKGIPFLAYADYRLAHVRDSVYVLMVGASEKKMSDAQHKALDDLKEELKLEVCFGDD
ncbi:hypothetical protein [Megasphaera massiliensis]|jgi:hypothetical protein|uniref:hypothetical protein n=1 Tax=Megasphaera massiliensis TaxID=1232428 RepID=UPI002069ED0D|nr:hypothetical protein [uncultured Megasphaera sp.]DAH87857.1 MAG TPA: peptidoglycan-recognition protein [Bacteriophage sp.]